MDSQDMQGETKNDDKQETFSLCFDADKFTVLETELTAWISLCPISVTTQLDPASGDVTFTLAGGQSAVLAKVPELMDFKDAVIEVKTKLDAAVIRLLTSCASNLDHVRAGLLSMGLEVIVGIKDEQEDPPGAVCVVCLANAVPNVLRSVEGMFAVRRLTLERSHDVLLASTIWQDQRCALMAGGDIDIRRAGNALEVLGFAAPVREAADVIGELLKGSSVSIVNLEVKDEHVFQLIDKHHRDLVDRIVNHFDHRIHIMMEKGSAGSKNLIKFKGGSNDTALAKQKVQTLISSIAKEEVPCPKPGMAHYLTDPGSDGPAIIQAFESEKSCVIHVNSASKPAAENVKVIKGDLVKQKVDVMVIPVTSGRPQLSSCGMVAKAAGEAGGKELKDDFAENHASLNEGRVGITEVTGKLPCSRVVYLAIRRWGSYDTRKKLSQALSFLMSELKRLKVGSVAFPTVGCGQLSFPAREVGQLIVEAAKPCGSIQVSIAVYSDDLYSDFSSAIRKVTKKCASPNGSHTTVSVGDITKTQADVVVSVVTKENGDVWGGCGQLARAVSEVAGRSFSREYSEAGGLAEGEVRVQDPHGLHCKKVYHVSIRRWKKGTDKMLADSIDTCLSHAQQAGYSKVAFPTLGCGQMGYRPHVVARILHNVIRKHPRIQVEVVAFKDDNIYKTFKEQIEEKEYAVAVEAETLTLGVYAKDGKALATVTKDLHKLIDKHYKECTIKFDPTGDPNNYHRRLRNELARIGSDLVFLQMDTGRKQIQVKGEKGATVAAITKVERVISTMKIEMKPQAKPPPACAYFKLCLKYLETLAIQKEYFDRQYNRCYCDTCHKKRGDQAYYTRGKPSKKYTTPVGWYKFALALPQRAKANDVDNIWNRCFHGTKAASIAKILEVGQLVSPGDEDTRSTSLFLFFQE